LIREVDEQLGVTGAVAECFQDGRDQRFVDHAAPVHLDFSTTCQQCEQPGKMGIHTRLGGRGISLRNRPNREMPPR
jgi:hypothetical protein